MSAIIISGEDIRRARERNGISQAELALVLGATAATISRWETGERIPRSEAARRLAAWLAQTPEPVAGKPAGTAPGVAIEVPARLAEIAAELGVDIGDLYKTVGTEAVRAELVRLFKQANAEAIRQQNEYIDQYGIPLANLRAW